MWKSAEDFIAKRYVLDDLHPGMWEEYARTYETREQSERTATLTFIFTKNYSLGASARLAQHWVYRVIADRATTTNTLLAKLGWQIADVDRDPWLSSASMVKIGKAWALVAKLGAHQTIDALARAEELLKQDNDTGAPEIPPLDELGPDARASIEWVAMTQLCQCACAYKS